MLGGYLFNFNIILALLEEIYVKRKPPLNLQSEDEKLFAGDYECKFKIHPILHLEKSIILQDTVFSPSHMSFYTTHTHVNSLGVLPIGKRIAHCILKKWRKIPHAIWIKDEWSANYFHWITDCLPRLWIGLNTGISDQVILHDSYRHLSYVSESLKILKVKAIFYQSNENLYVENLVLTPRTATFPNFNVELTQLTRKKFSIQSGKKPTRKIYISRKYAPKRKTHNEVDVELLMIKHGFEIFYSEKLNLKEQISLMSETKTLVSVHGAALTNMIFLPKESEVIELRNHGDAKTNCYFNLANALGLKYYYTLNQGDTPDTITSDFTIDLDALEKVISRLKD